MYCHSFFLHLLSSLLYIGIYVCECVYIYIFIYGSICGILVTIVENGHTVQILDKAVSISHYSHFNSD